MASKMDEDDCTDDTITPGHAQAAFVEFTRALAPHVDDLLWQPVFHGFLDLPIELRYRIYEKH
jgi:hypothetical protein